MTEEGVDHEEIEESNEDPPSLELLNLLPNPYEMPLIPLEDYLKAMGVFCIQMHNHLHPVEIAKLAPLFVSSKFHVKASPEIYMIATSLKEYLANVKYFRKTNPHYYVVSKNLSVDLNEDLGEATLIATMETHGLLGASDNLVRQSVYMGHWRRRKHTGRWYAQRLDIIRGPGSEPTF